ncbi:hypothetical protein IJM16_03705 [Candidatus Saccharibacteria bacterium]|nr:hypothetical protein [Candidatus Saccharibacteria bacterium]
MAKNHWDYRDTSQHWTIEQQLTAMILGEKTRFYNGVYPDSIEDVKIHTDGTAEVNLFGTDDNDAKGYYHFNIQLYEDGTFTIKNCHKK